MGHVSLPATTDPLAWALALIGAVVMWFMYRVERRLDRVAQALNGFTQGMMIEVLTRRDVPPHIAAQAREVLRTATDAQTNS